MTSTSNNRIAAGAALLAAIIVSVGMFTPPARALYRTEAFSPPIDIMPEITFTLQHYPHARFLNSYELGGPLIFYGQGKIPVFIDGRAETAYSKDIIRDYVAFITADKNWPEMLEHYHINGAIIMSSDQPAMDRLIARRGWRLVFTGKMASVFIRENSAR